MLVRRDPLLRSQPWRVARGAIWIFAAACLVLLSSRAARARELNVAVPAGCGSSEQFREELARRLGAAFVLPSIELSISASDTGYALRMQVGGEQRELHDTECEALFRAAVVVAVAILLPTAEGKEPPKAAVKAPPPKAAKPPPSPPAKEQATTPSAPARPSRPLELELWAGLGAGLNLGLVPHPTLALDAQLKAFARRRFGVAVAGRYLLQRELEKDDGRGVQVSGFGGQALLLFRPHRAWEAGLGASLYQLSGTGLAEARFTASALVVGPNLVVSFLPLQRRWFWVGVSAEFQWNAQRPDPTFTILDYGKIYTVPEFTGTLLVRLGPRFF